MIILVTGASGFVGSLLVPRLLDAGHAVRALGREPDRTLAVLEHYIDPDEVEVVRGDALMGEGLDRALAHVEVAYYLIHSMESTDARAAAFSERDRIAAHNFAAAAARAGVRRIVYLGGLLPRGTPISQARSSAPSSGQGPQAPPLSRHLASRAEVERVLLAAVADSVALRASIIIGARSRSFRLLVRLVERMPVLTLPAWRRFRTQPIDQRDAIAMLLACADAPVGGRSLEIGGPEVLTYEEILKRIAELMLVRRPALGLAVNMTPIAARVAAAIVSEDPNLVLPLMESLQGDLLPAEDDVAELLGVRLHSFDAAVERALAEWEEYEPLAAR
ncbi:MAG TPA: NAD(P)H-binding protein [Solirubrobacteraceae bacterium]|nr:NAD(P)H-binding protein [Solirubrobacteraceae bacterium]HME04504.1 NAD(P)H-binding protein [Solirubrobacteraceae bacterium]